MIRWYFLYYGIPCLLITNYEKVIVLKLSDFENTVFFEPKSWWKDYIYWILKSSCFELFRDRKYGLFSSGKVDGKLIFTDSWKVLVFSFLVMEIRSFSQWKSLWKDDIYLFFLSFPWYFRTWKIWFFVQWFTRTFNFSNLVGKELMVRLSMMTLFMFSILAFLILGKKPASISELAHESFLLLHLDCDLWPTSLTPILISEDLALLNYQSKKSLLKSIFILKYIPSLIFNNFLKLSANIAVPSLVRWRPSFQTNSIPISSLHMNSKQLVAHNTFSMLFTF